MTYGVATADNWSGGDASKRPPPPTAAAAGPVTQGTDANGVAYYDVDSSATTETARRSSGS